MAAPNVAGHCLGPQSRVQRVQAAGPDLAEEIDVFRFSRLERLRGDLVHLPSSHRPASLAITLSGYFGVHGRGVGEHDVVTRQSTFRYVALSAAGNFPCRAQPACRQS